MNRQVPLAGKVAAFATLTVVTSRGTPSGVEGSAMNTSVMSWAGCPPVASPEASVVSEVPGRVQLAGTAATAEGLSFSERVFEAALPRLAASEALNDNRIIPINSKQAAATCDTCP